MSAQGEVALRFSRVGLALGGRDVLRDVSFDVKRGEVVGLLGGNGAGKTSLLRLAARTLRPDRGEIELMGDALGDLSRREIARRLAVVAQETHVTVPFRAGELALMGRAPHQPLLSFDSREDVALARDAMERLGIGELAERSVLELSGGERQLVMLARALVQQAPLLLLDEPTAFLDLRHRIDVLERVRAIASEGHAVLVVSHDLALAARSCDRIALLADGKIAPEEVGPPSEVLTAEGLARAFGVAAEVVEGPDGLPLVVPRIAGPTAGVR